MGLLLLLLALVSSIGPSYSQSTWGMAAELTRQMMGSLAVYVGDSLGLTDMCPFATDFVEEAKKAIAEKILCQER